MTTPNTDDSQTMPISVSASYSADWLSEHAPRLFGQWQQLDDPDVRTEIADRIDTIATTLEHANFLDSIGSDLGDEVVYARELHDSLYDADDIAAGLALFRANQTAVADAAGLQAERERASAVTLDVPMSEDEVAAARSGRSTLNDAMVGAGYAAPIPRMDSNLGMSQGEDPAGRIKPDSLLSNTDSRDAAAASSADVTTGPRYSLNHEYDPESIPSERQRRDRAGSADLTSPVATVTAMQGATSHVGTAVLGRLSDQPAAHVDSGQSRTEEFEALPIRELWAVAAGPIVGDAVIADSGWAALAAALDRAQGAGWDWHSQLPTLIARADLPDLHPAQELHYRLLDAVEAAMPTPPGANSINASAVAPASPARVHAELPVQQQPAADRGGPSR